MREEACVRDHAMIGSDSESFDMPCPVEDFECLRHVEIALDKFFSKLHDLNDARAVCQQDSAGMERLRRVLDDVPWFGQVENDPIEIGLVDSVVAVAKFDTVTTEGFFAEERGHVLDRTFGEVLSQFVTHNLGTGPEHGHRQCA